MSETAEHPATAQKCCTTDSEEKTEGSSGELQIYKIKETEVSQVEEKDDQNEEKSMCKYMTGIGISQGTKQDIDKEK